MNLDTRVFPNIDALSRAALEELLSDLREAIAQRGRGAIALSGGHTPEIMYALWAASEKYRSETDWNRVHFFWGDERYVPQDDPLSNFRMTRETLLSHVRFPPPMFMQPPRLCRHPSRPPQPTTRNCENFSARPRPRSTSRCSAWAPRATPRRCSRIRPRSMKKRVGSSPFASQRRPRTGSRSRSRS